MPNYKKIVEGIVKIVVKEDKKVYLSWIKLVGGEKNVFLRDFLKNFKLA